MMDMRSCLHAIADCCVPECDREIVKAACDAGMAAGFYGSSSAIAQGLYRRLEGVRDVSRWHDVVPLEKMAGVGFDAGKKCRAMDVRHSVKFIEH
ncbi:hypothetical protein WS48_31080 [Burkholderia sp. RF7-non_BP1]|nr:hypothetical protein WS48_31080 [Burkholderia sp. RF7-non_BP1]KUY93400.1 hypothetical protein WS49_02765 [Burkholderia sp. RF7-non_BP4]